MIKIEKGRRSIASNCSRKNMKFKNVECQADEFLNVQMLDDKNMEIELMKTQIEYIEKEFEKTKNEKYSKQKLGHNNSATNTQIDFVCSDTV